jgi:hypothetical protein
MNVAGDASGPFCRLCCQSKLIFFTIILKKILNAPKNMPFQAFFMDTTQFSESRN